MEDFINSLPAECESAIKDLEKFEENFVSNIEVTTWSNHVFPPNFPAETARKAYYNWEPRKGDIFIVSYPKSGTHWLSEIVKNIIFHDDEDSQAFYHCSHKWQAFMSILEFGPASKFDIIDRLPLKKRIFISHLPPNLMNLKKIKKAQAKIVYVYRNPKDQTVSWYHFIRKVPYALAPKFKEIYHDDWNSFCKNYFSGLMPSQIPLGQWYPDHLLKWYYQRNDENIFFIAYEDLKKNFSKEVTKVAQFLGTKLSTEKLTEIANLCSFKKMKNEAEGSDLQDKYKLYRKGEVGEWKYYFSAAQSNELDQLLHEKLRDTDVRFTYEL